MTERYSLKVMFSFLISEAVYCQRYLKLWIVVTARNLFLPNLSLKMSKDLNFMRILHLYFLMFYYVNLINYLYRVLFNGQHYADLKTRKEKFMPYSSKFSHLSLLFPFSISISPPLLLTAQFISFRVHYRVGRGSDRRRLDVSQKRKQCNAEVTLWLFSASRITEHSLSARYSPLWPRGQPASFFGQQGFRNPGQFIINEELADAAWNSKRQVE